MIQCDEWNGLFNKIADCSLINPHFTLPLQTFKKSYGGHEKCDVIAL